MDGVPTERENPRMPLNRGTSGLVWEVSRTGLGGAETLKPSDGCRHRGPAEGADALELLSDCALNFAGDAYGRKTRTSRGSAGARGAASDAERGQRGIG